VSDKDKHFEDEARFEAPTGLANALKGLYGSDLSVPGEVDRAVLDRARVRLVRRGRRLSWPRWAAVAGAAAAVVLFGVVMKTQFSPVSDTNSKSGPPLSKVAAGSVAGDIDLNGCVDILDAFKLARHVESAGALDAKWDFNADGVVNRKDVDVVAYAAVRLDKGV